MELGLEGRAVVVTGGSKGIGLACARASYVSGVSISMDGVSSPIVV